MYKLIASMNDTTSKIEYERISKGLTSRLSD